MVKYNFDTPAKVSKKAIAFAQACVNDNTVGELVRSAEEYPDTQSMKDWGIVESGYKWAIQAALYAKIKDGSIMDDGRVVF